MGKRMTRTIRVALSVDGECYLAILVCGQGCGPRVGFRGDNDDRIQRGPFGRDVAERPPVVPFRHAAARRLFAGPRTLPRIPQGREDHYLPERFADHGGRRADGQLRHLLREPRTVGGQGQRRRREIRRQDPLHPAVVLECADQENLFERRFEDRAEQRPRCLHRRRFRIGRGVQGLAFSPHEGPYGGRDEAERRLRGHGFHVRAPGSETLRQPALRQPALRQSVRRPDVRIREGRSGPGDSRRAG